MQAQPLPCPEGMTTEQLNAIRVDAEGWREHLL